MSVANQPSDRASRILALLEGGLSFEEMAVALIPADEAELLRRAALLRRVELATFEIVAAGIVDDPAGRFTNLRDQATLLPFPQAPGTFTLRHDRAALLKRWDVLLAPASGRLSGTDVPLFRALNGQLADHFAGRGAAGELDHLYHRLAADPEAGILRMDELLRLRLPQADEASQGALPAAFAEARDGIALASAFDIVDVVESQRHLLTPAALEKYKAARRLVETWLAYCDCWYRTRRYIPRPRVHAFFDELLNTPKRPLLELWAPGGSGKTMSLRWLIASHCIPRRLPIAHLDFDRYLGQKPRPWQLLLRCIEQLDRQIAGAPFVTLIGDGREMERAWTSRLEAGETRDESRFAAFEIEFSQRFGNVLSSVLANTTTVIIVDTFEEAAIRGLTPVPDFIAMMVRLVMASKSLRLIVSGRYSLAPEILTDSPANPSAREHVFYAATVRREKVPRFDQSETLAYLAKRGIELNQEQLAKVFEVGSSATAQEEAREASLVDEAQGYDQPPAEREITPFYLALLADLIAGRESLEGLDELLQSFDQVKLIYLIERVIARIEDVGVRWLVRYGVVPRRLTREFFEQVILPFLERVHAGRTEDDDPSNDPLPIELQEKSLFFTDAALQHEGRDLWKQLRAFAGTDSWVEEQDSGESLIFHPYVREPMRYLLRQHAVLIKIHDDASRYCARKRAATQDAKEKLDFLLDEIYHRFQLEGKKAGEFYSQQIDLAAAEEDFSALLALAREIGKEEYRPKSEDSLTGRKTLIRARKRQFQAALSLFDLAESVGDTSARDRAFEAALQALTELSRFQAVTGEFEAMLQVRRPESRGMLQTAVQKLRDSPLSSEPELARSLALGEEQLGEGHCVEGYSRLLAERLADTGTIARPMTALLVEASAHAQKTFGSTDHDVKTLDSAFAALRSQTIAKTKIARCTFAVASLLQGWSRPEGAARIAAQSFEGDPALELIQLMAEAKTHPAKALEALSGFRTRWGARDNDFLIGEALVREARLHSLLANTAKAAETLAEASSSYLRARRSASAAHCQFLEARYWLHYEGDLPRAREALARRLRSIHSGSGAQLGLAERLLTFELEVRSGEATSDPESLLASAEQSSFPEEKLDCAMVLFAFLPEDQRESLKKRLADLLITAFERLPDFLARSNFAWLLRDVRFEIRFAPSQEKKLLGLLGAKNIPNLFGQVASVTERAWAFLSHAHLLRFVGRMDHAHSGIRYAKEIFSHAASLTGLREVWHLEALGTEHPHPEAFSPFRGKVPLLEAVVAVEQAEHALARGDAAAARLWLAGIELGQSPIRATGFATRAERILAQLEAARGKTQTSPTAPGRPQVLSESLSKGIRDLDDLDSRAYGTFRGTALSVTVPADGLIKEEWKRSPPLPSDPPAADLRAPKSGPEMWSLYPHEILYLGAPGPRRSTSGGWLKELAAFAGAEEIRSADELAEGFRPAPYKLVEALANNPEGFAALAAEVLAPLRDGGNHAPIDIAIVGEHLSGAGAPWELARLHSSGRSGTGRRTLRLLYRRTNNLAYRISWLQEALRAYGETGVEPSGIWDEATAQALRRLANHLGTEQVGKWKAELRQAFAQIGPGSRRPRATLLQSTEYRQHSAQRGIEFGGTELRRLYENLGFDCETLFGVGLKDFLRSTAAEDLPAILHIHAPYLERQSEGDVVPDLSESGGFSKGGERRGPRGGKLERLRQRYCPLLILDGPGEPDPLEQVRQIFLRNAAATLLSQNDAFPNILAMGLDHHPNLAKLEAMLRDLRSGQSLQEVYKKLSHNAGKIDGESLHLESGNLVPALWSADPDLGVAFSEG